MNGVKSVVLSIPMDKIRFCSTAQKKKKKPTVPNIRQKSGQK